MIGILLAYARACYSLVVVITAIAAAYCAFHAIRGSGGSLSVTAAFGLIAAVFAILAGHPIFRKLRGQALISRPYKHSQWMLVFLMSCFGSFAHFLFAMVGWALYEIVYVHPGRDAPGGPLGFALMISGAGYVVVLIMGEFGLGHDLERDRDHQARINPSIGRAAPLSGNTLDSRAEDGTDR